MAARIIDSHLSASSGDGSNRTVGIPPVSLACPRLLHQVLHDRAVSPARTPHLGSIVVALGGVAAAMTEKGPEQSREFWARRCDRGRGTVPEPVWRNTHA